MNKKYLPIILIAAITIAVFAADTVGTIQQKIIATSQFTREACVLETALDWRNKLGVAGGNSGSLWDPISTNILLTFQYGTANLTNWGNTTLFNTNNLATTNFVKLFQIGSANLTNWSQFPTSVLSGFQTGNQNITNWGQLSTNLLNGKQTGSANLTNWGTLGTNVLLGYIGTNNVITNTVWERIYSFSNAIFVPASPFSSNGTLTSITASDCDYRIDATCLSKQAILGQFNDFEYLSGVTYTTMSGDAVSRRLSDVNTGAESFSISGFTLFCNQQTYTFTPKAGTTITVTNGVSVTSADNYYGTNYFVLRVYKTTPVLTVTRAP